MAAAAGVDVSEIVHLEQMLKKMSKSAKKLYTDVKMGYLRQNANNESLEYSGY